MKANDILLAHDCYSNYYYFLQVVKATDKTVTVRRIYANRTKGIPFPNEFQDDERPITKRVKDGRISLGTWTGARVWDGTPLHEESPWGLNNNLY